LIIRQGRSIVNPYNKVIWVFVIGLSVGGGGWPGWGWSDDTKSFDSPDGLEQELQYLLSTGMAQSKDPTVLRRLSSLYLDLGYGLYVDREQQLAAFQEGARLAKKALEQQEASADAHFLYAANLGKAVQLEGLVASAFALQTLRQHVNRVLALDQEYAPAHHMLGLMYEELPWFLGGDSEAAGEHLKKAVSLDSRYAPGRLDLGRWYVKQGYHQEAVQELTWVVETPPCEKVWIWERIHRPQARDLLHQLTVTEGNGDSP